MGDAPCHDVADLFLVIVANAAQTAEFQSIKLGIPACFMPSGGSWGIFVARLGRSTSMSVTLGLDARVRVDGRDEHGRDDVAEDWTAPR